jgi:chromosome partitioning protein
MTAHVITLATSKGGVGKSTLARNLAAHWINIGMRVAIINFVAQIVFTLI